jgi:hypothetical protein
MAWAEDRAPWRHDPGAVPGAKTEGGRHDAALFIPSGSVPKRSIGFTKSKAGTLLFTLSKHILG